MAQVHNVQMITPNVPPKYEGFHFRSKSTLAIEHFGKTIESLNEQLRKMDTDHRAFSLQPFERAIDTAAKDLIKAVTENGIINQVKLAQAFTQLSKHNDEITKVSLVELADGSMARGKHGKAYEHFMIDLGYAGRLALSMIANSVSGLTSTIEARLANFASTLGSRSVVSSAEFLGYPPIKQVSVNELSTSADSKNMGNPPLSSRREHVQESTTNIHVPPLAKQIQQDTINSRLATDIAIKNGQSDLEEKGQILLAMKDHAHQNAINNYRLAGQKNFEAEVTSFFSGQVMDAKAEEDKSKAVLSNAASNSATAINLTNR